MNKFLYLAIVQPFQERPHLPQQLVFLNVVGLRGWDNLPSNISSSFWTTKIDWQWTSSCTWLLFNHFKKGLIFHNNWSFWTWLVYGAGITFLQISQAVFEQPRSTDNEQVLVLGYCSTISRKASSSATIGLFERGCIRGWYNLPSNISSSFWTTKIDWQWTSSCTWLLFNHFKKGLIFRNNWSFWTWLVYGAGITLLQTSQSSILNNHDLLTMNKFLYLVIVQPFQERPHLPQQLVFLNVVGLRGWYNLPSNISSSFLNNQDLVTMYKCLCLAIVQPFQERPHLPQQLVFLNVVCLRGWCHLHWNVLTSFVSHAHLSFLAITHQ